MKDGAVMDMKRIKSIGDSAAQVALATGRAPRYLLVHPEDSVTIPSVMHGMIVLPWDMVERGSGLLVHEDSPMVHDILDTIAACG